VKPNPRFEPTAASVALAVPSSLRSSAAAQAQRLGGPMATGNSSVMRPLRYSINVTLDGCCDHRAILPDEELHRHHADNIAQADALLFGRVTYEMMEAAWRAPARTGARPDWMQPWMEPFARTIGPCHTAVVTPRGGVNGGKWMERREPPVDGGRGK
jgi:hypothetical protein